MDTDTRLRVLEQQFFRLQARDEIWHVITRYARGIDEQRFDELEDIFTADVVSQTHPWGQRPLVGKAACPQSLSQLPARLPTAPPVYHQRTDSGAR